MRDLQGPGCGRPAAVRSVRRNRRGAFPSRYEGLDCGALIEPGHGANFGDLERTTTYVYLTGTLDAATWGAELALGDGRGRIYFVEPTGPIEDDPNLTNTRFPGNPTRSYRSREPLRVFGEVVDWMGHPAEQVTAMKEELKRLSRAGGEPID